MVSSANIPYIIETKILNKHLQSELGTQRRSYTMIKLVSFQECKVGSTYVMNIAQHMNRLKDRNHTVISTDTGKGLDKDQHRLVMKVPKRLRLLGHTTT